MMMYEFCAQTDRGLARGNNEDSVSLDESCGLAILADGMGGYNAGEVASGMATALIQAEMGQWLNKAGPQATGRDIRQALELCVGNSNRAVFEASQANSDYAGMGTTLVVGVFRGPKLVVGHIGDSRCYRLRGGTLLRSTRDHSLLQELLDAGLITPEQAAVSTHRNLVTRALGVEPTAVLEINEYKVEADDIYLLCSDGLSDMVDERRMEQLLLANDTLDGAVRALVAAANDAGGRDNIAVVLVRVLQPAPGGAAARSWWPFRR